MVRSRGQPDVAFNADEMFLGSCGAPAELFDNLAWFSYAVRWADDQERSQKYGPSQLECTF